MAAFAAQVGWPVVLKAVRGGYDGRGVWVCDGPGQAAEVLGYGVALLAEEYVPFVRELAALVARSPHRQGGGLPGRADRAAGGGLPGGTRARARAEHASWPRTRSGWPWSSRTRSG